jgi:hypothetical protein
VLKARRNGIIPLKYEKFPLAINSLINEDFPEPASPSKKTAVPYNFVV